MMRPHLHLAVAFGHVFRALHLHEPADGALELEAAVAGG
jgi:hypothetical protein